MANKDFSLPALSVNEDHSLSDPFNDDVDTRGTRIQKPLKLSTGRDTAVWKHTYTKGGPAYEVLTDDPVIDSLVLHGNITRPMDVEVTLKMFECDENVPVFEKQWEKFGWPSGDFSALTIAEGDALSGVESCCIDRFEIQVRVLSTSKFTALQLSQIDFNWEADDIEKCDC